MTTSRPTGAGRVSVVIHGAGRMGQQLAEQAAGQKFDIIALVSRHHPGDIGEIDWRPGLDSLGRKPDVLIDFSLPAGTVAAARWCSRSSVPMISGTTGLESIHEKAMNEVSRKVAVLHSANFSPGLNAMLGALAHLGQWLPEVEAATVTDVHHVHKKDSPSGTALALAQALGPLSPRVESRREGEVVGEHRVRLELPGETLSLVHEATDRSVFARGALQAARWLIPQPPGRYQALDWIMGQHKP